MTQPSASRNTRTGGLRRPALALALGAATASSVIAPIAAMAVTAPTYNDSTKTTNGTLLSPAKFGGTTKEKQTQLAKALPATAVPVATTGTIYGDVYSQALTGSAGVKRNALNKTYSDWKALAAPAVNAWLKSKKSPTTANKNAYAAALRTYNTKKGPAKWTLYSNAYTAWNAVYVTKLAAAKANHFKLVAGTYSGFGSAAGHHCSTSDNMTSGALYAAEQAAGVTQPFIGQSEGDQSTLSNPQDTKTGLVIRCNTDTLSANFGRLEYYLLHGSGDGVAAWEYFNETATVSAGKITSLGYDTDARLTSLSDYTIAYTTDPVATVNLAALPAASSTATKSSFNTYALDVLNKSGALDVALAPTIGKTCISAHSGATLTCLSFQKSLQKALTFAVKGMPY